MVWKGEMYLKQDRNITNIVIPKYIKFKEQKWIRDTYIYTCYNNQWKNI